MIASSLRLLAVLTLCLMLPASVELAAGPLQEQSQVETDLRTRISQQPSEPGGYLDLAKLYIEQGRFEEAARMISNALALTRRQIPAGGTEASTTTASALREKYPNAIRIGGEVREPRKLTDNKPVYPLEAQAANVQGIVILETLIDTQGHVAEVMVVRSVQMLDAAAVDAVKQWQYTPTLLNGNPVEVIMVVTVNFSLGG